MSKFIQTSWLTLNQTKTKVLKFTSAELPNALSLTYADHLVMEVETIKSLGLQLDDQISWKKHVQHLVRKLSAACFLIRQ
jgi:hypothetical protein